VEAADVRAPLLWISPLHQSKSKQIKQIKRRARTLRSKSKKPFLRCARSKTLRCVRSPRSKALRKKSKKQDPALRKKYKKRAPYGVRGKYKKRSKV
jgi:hypothetical protein